MQLAISPRKEGNHYRHPTNDGSDSQPHVQLWAEIVRGNVHRASRMWEAAVASSARATRLWHLVEAKSDIFAEGGCVYLGDGSPLITKKEGL